MVPLMARLMTRPMVSLMALQTVLKLMQQMVPLTARLMMQLTVR